MERVEVHSTSIHATTQRDRDLFFFFFSSRRRHTRCSRDWSSDVCSSDLEVGLLRMTEPAHVRAHDADIVCGSGGHEISGERHAASPLREQKYRSAPRGRGRLKIGLCAVALHDLTEIFPAQS